LNINKNYNGFFYPSFFNNDFFFFKLKGFFVRLLVPQEKKEQIKFISANEKLLYNKEFKSLLNRYLLNNSNNRFFINKKTILIYESLQNI
jgi:hypothetical protein